MAESTASSTQNTLTAKGRLTSWLVTYDMNASFFDLAPDTQFELEVTDAAHAVSIGLERIWKASFATIDIKKGWILLNVRSKAEAEQVMQKYPTRRYLDNLTYTEVYNATQGGIDLKIIWRGIVEFLKNRFR